jgi:hypothetical protein
VSRQKENPDLKSQIGVSKLMPGSDLLYSGHPALHPLGPPALRSGVQFVPDKLSTLSVFEQVT